MPGMNSLAGDKVSQESAVSEIDMKKVEDIVLSVCLPGDVSSFDLRFSKDSTGEPAVWVNFHICEDYKPSAKKIEGFVALKKEVSRKILDAGVDFWPYVRLVTDKA